MKFRIDGTGFYRLISIVGFDDATREQLKFIKTLHYIYDPFIGHIAALVQSLAEMRVTVYANSFSSAQSRGCSLSSYIPELQKILVKTWKLREINSYLVIQ